MSSALSSSKPPSEAPVESQKSRIPKWMPISAFIGTSLALAIPLIMIRRQRGNVARISLKRSNAPPPRKASGPAAPLPISSSSTQTASLHATIKETLNEENHSLMSALSRMNASSALLAAKAFAIATGLVAVGGLGMIWMVKTTLGVQDAREFGQRMRAALWSSAPTLTSRILRPPQTDKERQDIHLVTAFGVQEEWSWDQAEKRMERAYEEGGLPLWAQAALREVEAEARVERAKREQEIVESHQKKGTA
ncbi:hypothetical protein GALMADRAFT_241065 [Galerina marginata CBS 339.88]|uniref:Uncharacterized protein n=1 Tax=Galerina marginata (strain CBS 339.88) TaxID=685588 RepID=A0A067TL85_GALM3|nr:hypothetical protein GALMADRAFT_241065 [Galerina marginata CBS 339.88]